MFMMIDKGIGFRFLNGTVHKFYFISFLYKIYFNVNLFYQNNHQSDLFYLVSFIIDFFLFSSTRYFYILSDGGGITNSFLSG